MSEANIERVLYVEDEPDIQAVARVALEAVGGFEVQIYNSGSDAMDHLDEIKSFNPDVILLDVMMPGMDGPSTLEALRKERDFVDTPVIFMTAKVQPHEVADFKAMGALDVIPKPFDPMSLSQSIQTILLDHMEATA
ncbi:MAG: response regulator [Thiotrichaceae bacterium]|nr:response regulator [Thiotrichaceae bacterium]PCI13266.1 MAG: hypothetical protein COB71_06565 [Thiotrichales bacterium]